MFLCCTYLELLQISLQLVYKSDLSLRYVFTSTQKVDEATLYVQVFKKSDPPLRYTAMCISAVSLSRKAMIC